MRENSRIRLVKFEDFLAGESTLDEAMCIILLRIETWVAYATQVSVEAIIVSGFQH